jgi:hypothetical protein
MNNKVNIKLFIRTMDTRTVAPGSIRSADMFLFNRSVLAVGLALLVAGLPVLVQYFQLA